MGMKNTFNTVSDFVKVASEVVPHLKDMIKSMGDDKMREALSSEESMEVFANDLYKKLPKHVQMKCNFETFKTVIVANRNKLMKKKGNQKKVYGKALPKEQTTESKKAE